MKKIDARPINYFRSFVKDLVYRSSLIASSPSKGINATLRFTKDHIDLSKNYNQLKKENDQLRNKISESDYLILENTQLRKLIDEQIESSSNLVSSRVMLDKQSPYLNSFVIKSGTNHKIKNGMAVLDGKNFIGRIVDVNFFSSRVLLISDLNSNIPVVIAPSGSHAILSGHGEKEPTLEYLPENHTVKDGDKIYTSGRGAIFSPGIPIGITKVKDGKIVVSLFSDF